MTLTMNPYLNFLGTADSAMKFYASALGGTLEIMRFGDAPPGGPAIPSELKDRVMHASLKGDGFVLMASDLPPGISGVEAGKAVHINLNFTDRSEQRKVWDRLAVGAVVDQPLIDTFFGCFGVLTDKFGMHWMFNLSQ